MFSFHFVLIILNFRTKVPVQSLLETSIALIFTSFQMFNHKPQLYLFEGPYATQFSCFIIYSDINMVMDAKP